MDFVKIGFKKFDVVKTIHEDSDVLMLEVKDKKNHYVYKKYRLSEPFIDEFDRYTNLYKAGIRIPKIVKRNKRTNEVVFELFEGDHVDKVLVDSTLKLPDIYYEQLFIVYRFCRFSKIELNYLPENFILRGKYLYYDCLEIYNANTKINLENYGIYYWIKSKEAIKHLTALGYNLEKVAPLSNALSKKEIVLLSIKYW